jgi:hypothetical protein
MQSSFTAAPHHVDNLTPEPLGGSHSSAAASLSWITLFKEDCRIRIEDRGKLNKEVLKGGQTTTNHLLAKDPIHALCRPAAAPE